MKTTRRSRWAWTGIAVLAALCLPFAALAQTSTWDGGSATSDNWTDADNWGGTAPSAGDALVFQGNDRITPVNDFAANTLFSGITFQDTTSNFELSGNAFNLGGNITTLVDAESSTVLRPQTVGLNLALQQHTSFMTTNTSANASRLDVTGNISGDFGLLLTNTSGSSFNITTGSGVSPGIHLSGVNTYTGTTTVNAVSAVMRDPASLPGQASVLNGGTLFLNPAGGNKTFSNAITLSGEGQNYNFAGFGGVVGALVLNNGAIVDGTITLESDSRISAFLYHASATSGTISGTITGNHALTFGAAMRRPGTITLNGNAEWTGDTTIQASTNSGGDRAFTLALDKANALPYGDGYGNVIISGARATLNIGAHNTSINGLVSTAPVDANGGVVGSGSAILTLGHGNATAAYSQRLAVPNLVKVGTGTQVLWGSNAISGTTTVNSGGLVIGNTYSGGGIAVNAGSLGVDYTRFATSQTNDPADYVATTTGVTLGGGTTLAIHGRGDGEAIEQTGVGLGWAASSFLLPNAQADRIVVGQELFFERTGGTGTVVESSYVVRMLPEGANTRVFAPGAIVSGSATVTVTTDATTGSTSQTFAGLTLSGVTDSVATIDFGTTGTVTLTFDSAPIRNNDGAKLFIANWAGVAGTGGGPDRLLFTGTTSDFSSVFDQSEVEFDGYGAGYILVPNGGFYEVTAIPEPGTVGLLGLGALLLLRRRFRR